MDLPRKNQVSLRGASAREISRDALLEKVSQERELRSYTRRANAAALFIQRVWRRYYVTKTVALQLRQEWDYMLSHQAYTISGIWVSSSLLRPFLFFTTCLSTRRQRIQTRDAACIQSCFKILLESINSTDARKNFCSLVIGLPEERSTWAYQAQKLITLGAFILAESDQCHPESQQILVLTSLAMHLLVALTDLKGWKIVTDVDRPVADRAVKNLVRFMGSESVFYLSIRKYFMQLDLPSLLPRNSVIKPADDKFLITASVVTLALRPFHVIDPDKTGSDITDISDAPKHYILFLLTIPCLVQRLPTVLVPALKHKSVLSPCFHTLLTVRREILMKMTELDQPVGLWRQHREIPSIGWALTNIICLVTSERGSLDRKLFNQGLACASYVRSTITLAENLLNLLESAGALRRENQEFESDCETSTESMLFMDLLRPVCQQPYLMELLALMKSSKTTHGSEALVPLNLDKSSRLELIDIGYFYSYMIRIYFMFNPVFGPLPILNMLSFSPGFLSSLWEGLESSLFHGNALGENSCFTRSSQNKEGTVQDRDKQVGKAGVSKWSNVLHKITGKSQPAIDGVSTSDRAGSTDGQSSSVQIDEVSSDAWDIELLRSGPPGIPRDISYLLYLFCAIYSHLLLVLDDIEFYEKQVPFTLEQQRRITSSLNTLVYNGLARGNYMQNKPLMESAIKCLHLLYERDSRHSFCTPMLWLSPASRNRPPIGIAAKTHEFLSTKSDDLLVVSSMGSVITTMPYVYPFVERVEMFREFIKMDKVSRVMDGEIAGPGSRIVQIVIRRGHIIEDGFQQLNSLGSRLKSSIHVSFVSECGLPEAGLDHGGLSKEFLTDLSKAAFSPEYGLFSQTSTADRLLIPNASAKYLENGLQMIEFLGRVVGKALYEGILLDYSFSHVFVQKLLGRYSFLDELSAVDPELYKNLMYVKHYEGDVEELSLDFTVTEESYGKRHIIELKPGGKDACVTNENKMQYIHAIADYKLNRQVLPFANAFYRGLTDLISPSWLKLFNASEFNQLLSGGNHDIDVNDLRNNTRYTGGYSEGSRAIKLFWEVMKDFEPSQRCMVLKFVTSCSRAPLLGFKYLQPSFTIHKVACDVPLWATIGGQDVDRLPSASTCYNTLKLPTYKRQSTLKAKLLYAISSNAGFELS